MNLLLVSVDSLRLDHVSRTNSEIVTPRFDHCSRNFRFSDRCFTVSSATRPVHTSLFSGLYPFDHGIVSQTDERLRAGIPRLFELFHECSYRVGAFSEAAEIFVGLDYGEQIQSLPVEHASASGRLRSWLNRGSTKTTGQVLFVHYWATHAPYGAPDGEAMGETASLLTAGRADVVRQRYKRAVEQTFALKIAPLVESIDPSNWCIAVFGDHGESWRVGEELYHGITLRNSVLRVPLYLWIPGLAEVGLNAPIISIVDLFETIRNLFNLPLRGRVRGLDLRSPEPRREPLLAEIHPSSDADRDDAGRDVDLLLIKPVKHGRQWRLFDDRLRYTYDEGSGRGRLESTFEETPCDGWSDVQVRQRLTSLAAASTFAHYPLAGDTGDTEVLRGRLRALGYL